MVQDNHSGSHGGVLRGLHYQIGCPQGKLVRATAGEVFDVAVDLRRSSPTFRKWVGVRLSAHNHRQLWVPPGFAHGFYATSDWAEVTYKVTDFWNPECERTLLWNDPEIGVHLPLAGGKTPLLSPKDAAGSRWRGRRCLNKSWPKTHTNPKRKWGRFLARMAVQKINQHKDL